MNAPANAYRIDAIIHELLDNYQPIEREEVLRFSRTAIDVAGAMAAQEAHFRLVEHPKNREVAKHLLEDLEQLETLLRRLQGQNPEALVTVLPAPLVVSSDDPVRDFINAAHSSYNEVVTLQDRCREFQTFIGEIRTRWGAVSGPQPSNADPLVHWFIQGGMRFRNALLYEYGIEMPRRVLVRWLAAGWEDLEFPCEDSRGEARGVLESWISSRLNAILRG